MDKDLKPSEGGKRVTAESQILTVLLILLSCGICFVCLISDVLMALRQDVLIAGIISDIDVCVATWTTGTAGGMESVSFIKHIPITSGTVLSFLVE